jgi:hypothetical protein
LANGRIRETEEEGPKFVSAYDALSHVEGHTGEGRKGSGVGQLSAMCRDERDMGGGFQKLNENCLGAVRAEYFEERS